MKKVNEKGTARLNINLNQGTYIIVTFNPYNGEMASNNILLFFQKSLKTATW